MSNDNLFKRRAEPERHGLKKDKKRNEEIMGL